MADEELKPEADAPPGADQSAGGAAQPPTDQATDQAQSTAAGAEPDQGAKKAAKPAKLEAAAAAREPARKTAVAKILRGHFYEGDDYRRPTRKGPGEMIELPIDEIERFQRLGLLEDKRRIIPTTMVGPQFFRDDAPGR